MTGRVFFITGTAPSVGKTTVATALAAALVNAGCPVQAIKPVASGDHLPGRDALPPRPRRAASTLLPRLLRTARVPGGLRS